MGLRSMTGYGCGEAIGRGLKVEVELSSVNRKQFDLHFNLPRPLVALESRVYDVIHRSIARGGVTGSLRVSAAGRPRDGGVRVDVATARACVSALRRAGVRLGLKDDLTVRTLVNLPELVRFERVPEDPEIVWPLASRALKHAVRELLSMRIREGAALEKDLLLRFRRLGVRLDRIRRLAPEIPVRYSRILVSRLKRAKVILREADPQILREVALFADRSDITEEIVRLDSHFKQALDLARSSKAVGRTLDFLCQEMFREVNTIGSKANDARVSRHVIAFKADLEVVREQAQNIE